MASPSALESVQLNFLPSDLLGLHLALGVIMYGVALEVRWEDFSYLRKNPRGFLLGVFSQCMLLPFLTWVFVSILQPPPSIALGLFLVAACPGGNVSNFLTHFAKGNTALSISLTAFSSVAAVILTPFNFTFWASTYAPTSILLKEICLEPYEIFFSVGILLGVPLVLGILTSSQLPRLSQKLIKVIKPMSLVFFAGFILMAFANNFSLFIDFIGTIFLWVFLHNGLALTAGFATGIIGKLPYTDIKTLSIETGIQNSGLGLVLIFSFFDGIGGMAIIAAWWGIWHLISGIILASYWRYSS